MRNPPDYLEEYTNEYGYLGSALHSAVVKARMTPPPTSQPSTSVISATSTIRAPSQQSIIASTAGTRLVVGNQARPSLSGSGQQQKYVLLTRPPPPNAVRKRKI